MTHQGKLGGIIHTYQKYDPKTFPSPTQPPPDMVSPMFEHWLLYGGLKPVSDEDLAKAIRLDPSQIAGLGPSLEMLISMLLERKRQILEKYEVQSAREKAQKTYQKSVSDARPPSNVLRLRFDSAVKEDQLYDFERLWYAIQDDQSPFARQLVQVIDTLGNRYQIEELAAKYTFTGRTGMSIAQALQIKAELEKIDELLRQLEQARQTAQLAIIDMQMLSEFTEPADLQKLEEFQRSIQNYIRELAERQGLEHERGGFRLTPKAYRLFQGRLLETIFSKLQSARSGRHTGPIVGEGAVELQSTKPYEFGDSLSHMDIAQSFVNAMLRDGSRLPIQLRADDIEIHKTRNNPKCATVVILDMSGSMRYDGQYVNVKRMGLALDGLIRREYPGDFLHFIEMYTFAKPRRSGELIELMPKPVTIFDPIVRYRIDMSRDNVRESMIPAHFTNIQHSLQLARRLLANQNTPNRQIVLITDGLPTAHFDGTWLYMLYPPDPLTESATLREGMNCARDNITINTFLVPSWSQSEEDIRFAYRLSESTKGRVFFTAGKDLDRFVVWDYVSRRREVVS